MRGAVGGGDNGRWCQRPIALTVDSLGSAQASRRITRRGRRIHNPARGAAEGIARTVTKNIGITAVVVNEVAARCKHDRIARTRAAADTAIDTRRIRRLTAGAEIDIARGGAGEEAISAHTLCTSNSDVLNPTKQCQR